MGLSEFSPLPFWAFSAIISGAGILGGPAVLGADLQGSVEGPLWGGQDTVITLASKPGLSHASSKMSSLTVGLATDTEPILSTCSTPVFYSVI